MGQKKMPSEKSCPCGSGKTYQDCCQRYLDNQALAPDPETLMRSRYTAFCRNDIEYILKTWHPETKPDLEDDEPSNWVSLEILGSSVDGDEGEVEFKAKLIHGSNLETLHEASDFLKVDGAWLYHSGEFLNEGSRPQKISQKDPCPCGSGEKFKHCHGGKS